MVSSARAEFLLAKRILPRSVKTFQINALRACLAKERGSRLLPGAIKRVGKQNPARAIGAQSSRRMNVTVFSNSQFGDDPEMLAVLSLTLPTGLSRRIWGGRTPSK